MFKSIPGGFVLKSEDQNVLTEQRTITYNVNQNFIQVGAIFLKTSSKNPFENDWFTKNYRDTNLQQWIDDEDAQLLNVGFNLQMGWVDVDIDSDDPEYNKCVTSALRHVGVDTRFKFGRSSFGTASHVLVQLNEDESSNFDMLKHFEPNGFRRKGKHYKTEIRSFATNTDRKNLVREAKQTVMPGSIYVNKTDATTYDISVWFDKYDKIARNIKQIAETTTYKTSFSDIIRGIAFGTLLYLVKPFWVEGGRQIIAQKLGGWLARVVKDSIAMNTTEALGGSVYCPVDSDDIAESLIDFLCEELGDDENNMRKRVFRDARKKIDRNPDAHIPGWPMMEQSFGGEIINALRSVLMPGSDTSALTKMAERYIYDETDDRYIDRDRFGSTLAFVHQGPELERRHRGDFVQVGNKKRPAFKLFEVSPMRQRVSNRDLYPDFNPGGIFRVNRLGEQISDDDELEQGVTTVFNTWRGWPVGLPLPVDERLLNTCVTMLDRLLNYLTRDNQAQAMWLKKWIAWIIQNPGTKQQIAPVVVGGQGIGKSFFGNTFLPALMGSLAGNASPKVLENVFAIEPFIGKMCVFIDEAKFHNEAATDEIKKIIRNVNIGGAEKFQSSRDYRIFSRIIFASNRFDMNIGQINMQDRALFYIKAYDKDHMGFGDAEFRAWAWSLKEFFDEFNNMLMRREVREHYMHYFMNVVQVTRHEIETIEESSSTDREIVISNMSWARRIAKYIVEDGRIFEDADITMPFHPTNFNNRVLEVCKELGMKNVQASRVMAEFEDAGLIEKYMENNKVFKRFKYKIGTLTEKVGEAFSVQMDPQYEFTEEDMGENDTTLEKPKPWKGLNRRIYGKL